MSNDRYPRFAEGSGSDRTAGRADGCLRVRVPAQRIDLDPDGPAVSVVIPAMNEARNLPWLAARMPAGVAELILVDGHSVDSTIATARSLWPGVRIIWQNRRGKGNALACGFAAATGEIIVMIDADGSMDPGEIPYFVAALVAGADYAKGSRFTPGGGSSDITRFRAVGNHVLNGLTALVHRTSYTDLCYGFNAFWRRILPVLALEVGKGSQRRWGDGFEVETLINIRVHSAGLKVTEVPSFEGPRLHGTSNLHAFGDGWRVLSIIAHESRALRNSPHVRSGALAQLLEERTDASCSGRDDAVIVPGGENLALVTMPRSRDPIPITGRRRVSSPRRRRPWLAAGRSSRPAC
jgi:Glycosyl transferase family 2